MIGPKRPVIAIFASGNGTTFRVTADAIHDGLVDFDIGLMITDHEDAGVLDMVADVNRRYGFSIKTAIINKQRYPEGKQGKGQTAGEAEVMIRILQEHRIDHVVLMGCLRIIAPQVVEAYGWKPEYAQQDPEHNGLYLARMSNTHPGILPETGGTFGIHAQEKVLELGLEETAHSFHILGADVDTGPMIAEHRVRVFSPSKYPIGLTDTPEKLFARVQRVEKAYLPLDIDAFLKEQVRLRMF